MNKVIKNIFWRFAENCSTQIVSFIVSIILARLLLPEDYGIIAIVMVIVNILTVFVNCSLATTLIQKKDVDDLDYSTVFFFNVFMALVLYMFIYLLSPNIAKFYKMDDLTKIIRVMSVVLFGAAIKNVQNAYATKNMRFKKFFFSSLIGTIGSAILGITMAYMGYGVWSLVGQQIFDSYADSIILWFTVGWRPKLKFSLSRLKALFGFGSKLLISTFIENIYTNISSLIVGKIYTSSDLAYYNKGEHLPKLVVTNINAAIESVMLPVISNEQDNYKTVKELTKKSIKLSTYIIFPLALGIAAVSRNFVLLFYTSKWINSVPYICIFAFMYMLYPIKTSNLNSIKALGRGNTILTLEIIEKVIGIIVILLTMRISVLMMAIGCLVISFISLIVYSIPNRKVIDYGFFEQLSDYMKNLILSLFMFVVVYVVGLLKINLLVKFVSQVLIGILIYIIGSSILKIDSFYFALDLIKSFKNK